MTNATKETTAPLAHLHPLMYSPLYWSHAFIDVCVGSWVIQVFGDIGPELIAADDEAGITLTSDVNGNVSHHNILLADVHLLPALESINLYHFVQAYRLSNLSHGILRRGAGYRIPATPGWCVAAVPQSPFWKGAASSPCSATSFPCATLPSSSSSTSYARQ